jgi:DNA-binding CsgD family transcriptional regulator
MPLIEREPELERLDAALAAARAGRGGALVIEGPPGIGKTTLLDAVRERATAADTRLLTTSAAELENDLGFSVVRALFDPVLASVPRDERELLLTGAAQLATGPLGLSPDAAPVELGSAVHGIYWLCANLADRGPLVIAVDDLHWADEPSLLFLSYLSRRVAELPILICTTTRPMGSEPAERFLSAIAAAPTEVLRLSPLSADGVARLVREELGTEPDAAFTAACADVSGGNPFLLTAALVAIRQDGIEPTAAEADRLDELRAETLPRSLLTRIARLGPEARQVATAIAVLGLDTELRHVVRLSGLDTDTVAGAIAGLRREGILTTMDGRLDFAHPLIRTTVYTDVAEPERGLAHLSAARFLDVEGERERVASHLLSAERNADNWVVGRLRDAAAAALAGGAPASAALMLERALNEPAAEDERPAIDLDLGRAHLRSGHVPEAREALERALSAIEEPEERAPVALELGRVLRLAGRPAEAVAVLDQALKVLPDGHHDEEMLFEAEIATASHIGLPAKEWVDRLAAVVERADGASLPDRMIRGLYAYVAASTGTRSSGEVERLALSAMQADTTDPALHLQMAGSSLAMSGSYAAGLTTLDQALEATRDLGDAGQFGFISLTRSWVAHRAGRVRESEADARAGLSVAVDGLMDLSYAVASLAVPLIERGAVDEAVALLAEHGLEEVVELDTAPAASLFGARGRLRRLIGRPRDAIADIERCRDVVVQLGFISPAFVEWRHDLALAHVGVGEVDLAREVAAEDLAQSRAFGAPREVGMALRSSGIAEGGTRGLELLAESVEVLSGPETPLDHAKSLVELGAALRRASKRSDARDHLLKGLDGASRCGSLAVVGRARDELTAAGARPRRERLSGPDSLTASELRVAKLAADGRSNPEIAQALFVTRRTVEVHLTHAYRKLGIESRDQLAAALTSDGQDG